MTNPPLRSGSSARLDPPLSVRRAGAAALLAEYPGTAQVLAAAAAVRALAPEHLLDLVPAERTLLLSGTSARDLAEFEALLRDLTSPEEDQQSAAEVTLGIVYDGEDLEVVAQLLGMSTNALITAHSSTTWTAAFGGFAPGFSYLVAPDRDAPTAPPEHQGSVPPGRPGTGTGGAGPPWDVPRRAEPRTAVPAGAVGLAAHYCAVYPRATPGGWQLIGRSDAELFDPRREPPALLGPGTRVRFTPQRPAVRAGAAAARVRAVRHAAVVPTRRGRRRGPVEAASTGVPVLAVRAPGPLALLEDAGRGGRAAIGVGTSGAFDHGAMVRANLAVGNPAHAAVVEALVGPLFLAAVAPCVVAVSGAPAPVTVRRRDGDVGDLVLRAGQGREQPIALDAGDTLELGPAASGLRLVLAVRGGIGAVQRRGPAAAPRPHGAAATRAAPADAGAAPEGATLGSMSRDTLSALGPGPLAAGDLLLAAAQHGLDAVPAPAPESGVGAAPDPSDAEADRAPDVEPTPVVVPFHLGPRDDLLGETALTALRERTWTVRPDSDRVGVRLDGQALPVPVGAGSLPSEAVVPGAIQVPPSGLPVVFGPDHPTTGGYPVVAVVTRAGLDLLAQAAPGTAVSFARADET